MRTQRTYTAVAAAAVGALLLSGCSSSTTADHEPSAASATNTASDVQFRTDTPPSRDDDGPAIAPMVLAANVAVWDQGLSFDAANAFAEAATESVGNTDAMPEYDAELIAA